MAVYKIFPSKDSTIYSINPDINSGLDEILEISYKNNSLNYFNSKVASPSFDYSDRSRILIHFDDLYNKIEELNLTEYDLGLKLYIATASSLKDNLKIIAHPVSSFWENGIGKNYNNVSEGVSWNKSTSLTNWLNPGGDFSNEYSSFQNLNINSSKDINLNITDFKQYWDSNENNGIILKLDEEYLSTLSNQVKPNLKYFSSNTHTIYPPHLEIKWDDSVWNNENNLEQISDTDIYIGLSNNKGEFEEGSINKFRINVRPKYPKRKYQTTSVYTDNYILPDKSCYAIKDLDTNEFIIDFDETYTKISCDYKGNFFILYMDGLQPERYYEILIRSKINNEVIFNENKLLFKIKKNINE